MEKGDVIFGGVAILAGIRSQFSRDQKGLDAKKYVYLW